MMDDAAVFSVLSKCFGSVEKDEWKQMTRSAAWAEFMDGVRRLLQGRTPCGRRWKTAIRRRSVRPKASTTAAAALGNAFS